jgi:hypothetical protein
MTPMQWLRGVPEIAQQLELTRYTTAFSFNGYMNVANLGVLLPNIGLRAMISELACSFGGGSSSSGSSAGGRVPERSTVGMRVPSGEGSSSVGGSAGGHVSQSPTVLSIMQQQLLIHQQQQQQQQQSHDTARMTSTAAETDSNNSSGASDNSVTATVASDDTGSTGTAAVAAADGSGDGELENYMNLYSSDVEVRTIVTLFLSAAS